MEGQSSAIQKKGHLWSRVNETFPVQKFKVHTLRNLVVITSQERYVKQLFTCRHARPKFSHIHLLLLLRLYYLQFSLLCFSISLLRIELSLLHRLSVRISYSEPGADMLAESSSGTGDHTIVKGTSTHHGRYVQYNVYGNLFEVSKKYVPPIRPVGRGAYGIVW